MRVAYAVTCVADEESHAHIAARLGLVQPTLALESATHRRSASAFVVAIVPSERTQGQPVSLDPSPTHPARLRRRGSQPRATGLPPVGLRAIGSIRSLRAFAYGQPADMRKGFDGLYGLVPSTSSAIHSRRLLPDSSPAIGRRAQVPRCGTVKVCACTPSGWRRDAWPKCGREDPLELTMSELQLFLERSAFKRARCASSPARLCLRSW